VAGAARLARASRLARAAKERATATVRVEEPRHRRVPSVVVEAVAAKVGATVAVLARAKVRKVAVEEAWGRASVPARHLRVPLQLPH
tara:strand:+ start:1640 stop:1900 length:261 start_codon:yes stop_codon:yes gene_type:complete